MGSWRPGSATRASGGAPSWMLAIFSLLILLTHWGRPADTKNRAAFRRSGIAPFRTGVARSCEITGEFPRGGTVAGEPRGATPRGRTQNPRLPNAPPEEPGRQARRTRGSKVSGER